MMKSPIYKSRKLKPQSDNIRGIGDYSFNTKYNAGPESDLSHYTNQIDQKPMFYKGFKTKESVFKWNF